MRPNWLSRLLAPPRDEARAESAAPPVPAAAPVPYGAAPEDLPLSDLAALAEQLADLIAATKGQLDGAVQLVDRSAEDAAEYGRALAADADTIGATGLPADVVESVLGLTRTMIVRTQAAEQRLRATNSELRGLQRDLDQAHDSAERDPLTGLPNRRAIEYALQCAIATAEATNAALSVAFCDIDAFQRLNDIHGHAVGDRILRLVADALVDGAGDGAFVGRQASEQFILLFDGVAAIDAAARVDTVRAGLAARSLRSRSDGTPIGTVTFSAGVAGRRRGEEGADLIGRADQALLRAKQSGGNQVMIDAGD